METFYVELGKGRKQVYNPEENKLRLLLFMGGKGLISQDDTGLPVGEPSLYVSGLHRGFFIL